MAEPRPTRLERETSAKLKLIARELEAIRTTTIPHPCNALHADAHNRIADAEKALTLAADVLLSGG